MTALLVLLLAAAPAVDVELVVKKPLKLAAKGTELKGVVEVKLTNRGEAPVTLQHRDVHGFRFQPAAGSDAGTQVVFHSCDCGFELGMQPQPGARTFTLKPGEKRSIIFDDFTCGGGAFRPPLPGRYQLTWSLGEAPASPVKPSDAELDLKQCEVALRARPAEAFESKPVAVKL